MSNLLNNFRSILLCSTLLCSGVVAQQSEEKKTTDSGEPAVPTTNLSEAKPLEAGAPVDPKTYLIGTEDVVGILVWREPQLSGPHTVRPDGMVTLPLVGDIPARGLTPEKFRERLTQSLGSILVNPQVTVSIQQVNSKKYYITGEVNRTGPFPLVTPITVLEALSSAGGLREYAKKKKIKIWRAGTRIDFNYKEVIEGKNLDQNIYLEPGDHIIVP